MNNTKLAIGALACAIAMMTGAAATSAFAADTGSAAGGRTSGAPYGAGPGDCPGWGGGPGMMGGGGPGWGRGGGMGPGMMGGWGGGGGPGMMGGWGGGWGGPGMMAGWGCGGWDESLKLTPEQRTKIDAIVDQTRKTHWALMGAMMDQQAKLRDLYQAPNRDTHAIDGVYQSMNALRRQMYDSSVDAHKQIEGVLTKKQLEQFREYWHQGDAAGW